MHRAFVEFNAKSATINSELATVKALLERVSASASLARRAVAVCTDIDIISLHSGLEDRLASALHEVSASLPQESQCDRTLVVHVQTEQLEAIYGLIGAVGQLEAVALSANDVTVAVRIHVALCRELQDSRDIPLSGSGRWRHDSPWIYGTPSGVRCSCRSRASRLQRQLCHGNP